MSAEWWSVSRKSRLDPNGNLANGAVYILSAQLVAELRRSPPAVTDLSTQLLPTLLGAINAYETSAPLIDIGTPRTYALANELARARL
jgi:mannose-1-phosphate guanylyltransferase